VLATIFHWPDTSWAHASEHAACMVRIKANSLLRFDANKYLIRSHLEVESDNAGEVLYLSA
jgi:hypothetical protein